LHRCKARQYFSCIKDSFGEVWSGVSAVFFATGGTGVTEGVVTTPALSF